MVANHHESGFDPGEYVEIPFGPYIVGSDGTVECDDCERTLFSTQEPSDSRAEEQPAYVHIWRLNGVWEPEEVTCKDCGPFSEAPGEDLLICRCTFIDYDGQPAVEDVFLANSVDHHPTPLFEILR